MNVDFSERWDSFKENLNFIFSWRGFFWLTFWPWLQIPKFFRWWIDCSDSIAVRSLMTPAVLIILVIMAGAPTITGYPIVWGGTYYYNYTSVIYPTPIKIEKTDQGKALVNTMVTLGDQMLVNWQDNDLPWSASKTGIVGTDNPRNFQLGELGVYRRVTEEFREHLTRTTTSDRMEPRMVTAFNSWAYTSDKWMMISSESSYGNGLDALKSYQRDLNAGTVKLTVTSYNLDRLLDKLSSSLSEVSQQLEDGTNGKVSWLLIDKGYFRAQGAMFATVQVLKAAQIDFAEVLKSKQATDILSSLIQKVEADHNYMADPWVVMNGYGGTASHLALLNQAIQGANREMDKLRNTIIK